MSVLLFDHLWQSTIVLAAIGLLTLFFNNNGAHVRHALWTAASIKFLVPFAVLSELGRHLSTLLSIPLPGPPMMQGFYDAAQPFSDRPVFVALPGPNSVTWLPLLVIWGVGFFAVVAIWLSRWLKLRATLRRAREMDIAAPMPVMFSPSLLEPGLIGILRPVVLLPEGIMEKLTPAELQSILAHEACHLRRRDNLLASIHMLVEGMFWFYPPVWWIGTRLIKERERACDEAVVKSGHDPLVYAESILKVCKFYVYSPLACASGICGADLKKRMKTIMKNQVSVRLNAAKKFLLAGAAALAIAAPLATGLVASPPVLAQINTQVNRQNFSIRVVDESIGKDALRGPADDDRVRMAHPGDGALWLKRKGQIDGDILADASVSNDHQTGKPVIDFRLTSKGRDQFAQMTRDNIGHRLAVFVNGTVITAPTVITPILGGTGHITGDFATEAEAKTLAAEMMGTNYPVKP